jgi:predicted dehydrogenase/threonine dehydrogenase-like Zn-dependent dehydrogenase
MRQVLLNGQGAVVARMPRPPLEPGSVLIRVRYSLISVGTEVAGLRANPILDHLSLEQVMTDALTAGRYLRAALSNPRRAAHRAKQLARMKLGGLRTPQAPATPAAGEQRAAAGSAPPEPSELGDQGWSVGYSLAGEVVAVGAGITDLAVGDRVAAAGAGLANHADFASVRRNLVCRVPAGVSLEDAASATVGSIALQGVRRAEPQLGETVAVLGLGLIGQMMVQLLAANGCTVMGLDLDGTRVARAGLEPTHGASDPATFKKLVDDATEGRGVDRTLITAATKSDAVINLAMQVTRAKGRVVIVGDVGLHVERAAFYRKEIDLLMSTSYGPGRYDRAYEEEGRDYPFAYVRWTLNRNMQAYLGLIANGSIDISRLIDRVADVRDAPVVYSELAKGGAGVPLGVLLSYPQPPDAVDFEATRITVKGHTKIAAGGRVRWALVGVGGFGTGMLVPQLQRVPERFVLRGVVSRDAARGGNFARSNGIEVLATDLDAVLQDPEFDLVVIATRHHEHADQVVRSLAAGKHVFVEKPLALTWSELDRVVSTYRALEAPPVLMVGFNRRFSPALQRLGAALRDRRSPLVVHYRVNAGYVPPDHWVQDARGGGRNLGEACHMYDVFRFLARGDLTSIGARAIDPGLLPYKRNDNFVATLSYADGSVASLVYTALGPKQGLPKERIEVFADGEAYVLDDFKTLIRTGDGAILWRAGEADKGHFEEIKRLGEAIVGNSEPPIPFEHIVETTAVALTIEDLLYGRTEGGPGD